MPVVRITKKITLEMAHSLWNYPGPCGNIHGHSYTLYVTISGEPAKANGSPEEGMVLDFSNLKKVIEKEISEPFDHSLILNDAIPFDLKIQLTRHHKKVCFLGIQPTCENLVLEFSQRIKNSLPGKITLHSLKLQETDTGWAEWFQEDQG
ncbi:MAG: hypothetical protein A3H98_12445 [Bacteroidetes bacterium RIFCSPLOWO2_02_FULL_36_8]|nr:MAG: hypothetical protein A3H98_12445 [Bacteroidetes bacterium RIFCSPLOWO2_02_FULL_36_8]OFY72268.1 MAG: hypothetical protein A3G23_01265 [Bacteroidetes bacterium RIFCSPLOWO2_12_FULL_37_12]